jgi:hypothetical protein
MSLPAGLPFKVVEATKFLASAQPSQENWLMEFYTVQTGEHLVETCWVHLGGLDEVSCCGLASVGSMFFGDASAPYQSFSIHWQCLALCSHYRPVAHIMAYYERVAQRWARLCLII